MGCQAIRSWTASKLIGAFLDLAIAYVLLCCSTTAFFISEFLGFFGFSLPCSCHGIFSIPNTDQCLQKLLVDGPVNKISAVQMAVKSRFPFDSVWERNEDPQLSFKVVRESGVIELEGEASCSSVSAARASQAAESVDLAAEGKFDVKGKGVVRTRRQRGNLRRRRKSSTDHLKLTPHSSYDNVSPGAPVVPLSNYGNSHSGKEFSDDSAAVDSHDVVEPSHVMDLDHKSWFSSESNGVIADKDMVPLESQRNDAGPQLEHDSHLENAVRMLEQALKEERAARSALFFDLEKERTAAATATDEAMAMILRLQEEKAAIELEARQYERILEEKSTYDAEEMDVLKEIIVRREMEKHFLEKEVESYRKAHQEKELFEEDARNMLHNQGETLLVPGENERLVMQQAFDSTRSTGIMHTDSCYTDYASISVEDALPLAQFHDILETAVQYHSSSVEFSQEFQEKGLLSGASREGCKPSTSHDHGYQEKSIVLIGEVKDDGETESNEQYDGNGSALLGGNLDAKEQCLYDIHVIDENCTSQEENNAESSMTHDDTSNAVGKLELPFGALEVQMVNEPSSCTTASSYDAPQISSTLPPLRISTSESKFSDLRRHSIAAVDNERQKLDNEVGYLRERLRSIQAGRSKLNFPSEHKDKGETELLLLDDIAHLLQEIRKLTEPQKTTIRRTSLPPPGSKDTSKKRRCRSASAELCQSS